MDSLPPAVILVCSCPHGSKLPPATAQRISNLPPGPPEARFKEWTRRLTRAHSPLPVESAGSGDAWNQIRAGFRSIKALKDWWVAFPSAGLLHHGEMCPHALASFDPEHPEAPAAHAAGVQTWWDALARSRADAGYPGGLAGLVRRFPAATYLVVLGADALAAMQADLWEAKEASADGNRFLILTGAQSIDPGLGTSLLRVDARFEKMLGGPRATVTSRMARHLMTEFSPEEWRADFLQGWMRQMSWRLPRPEAKPKSKARRKIGSLELEIFVRQSLTENPRASTRSLHKKLLSSGRSCSESALAAFHLR